MKRLKKVAVDLSNLIGYVCVYGDAKEITRIEKNGIKPSTEDPFWIYPTIEAAKEYKDLVKQNSTSTSSRTGAICKVNVNDDDVYFAIVLDGYSNDLNNNLVPIFKSNGVELSDDQLKTLEDRYNVLAEDDRAPRNNLASDLDDFVPEHVDVDELADKIMLDYFNQHGAYLAEHKKVIEMILDEEFKQRKEQYQKLKEEFHDEDEEFGNENGENEK